jgi:S-DNA-T family DNA segregation ATPase FtsK/SpoIIIE
MSRQKKSKKSEKNKNKDLAALFFVLAAFISAYSIFLPYNSGIAGEAFSNVVFQILGAARYIVPIVLLWFFVLSAFTSLRTRNRLDFLWSTLAIASFSTLIISVNAVFGLDFSVGWMGERLYPFVERLLGDLLAFFVLGIVFVYSLAKLFRIPILHLFKSLFFEGADAKKEPVIVSQRQQKQPAKSIFSDTSKDDKTDSIYELPNIVIGDDEAKKKGKRAAQVQKIDSSGIDYVLPSPMSLTLDEQIDPAENRKELLDRAELLKQTLLEFDVKAEVKDIIAGPVVTRYDLLLAPGVKPSDIKNVIDNISLAMRTSSIRVVPIAEKGAVGIEVANPDSIVIGLRGIVESSTFQSSDSKLTLALGETTDGKSFVARLEKMPHLLIAGATGSGKSVGIHSVILSILFKARPDEVKFMLIDPKRVELPIYKDIPHLYNPCIMASQADIIINPNEAANALRKLVMVMEERFDKYSDKGVRNIEEYNIKALERGDEKEFFIVVIIDELADLMLVAKKEIEDSIQRLAQMGRAAGIHLILATQRPSVDVITGVIKANFPARISFQTVSKTDSRVILDVMGAENLLGKGDMLFLPPSQSRPIRLQGAYVSLSEIETVVNFIEEQNFPKVYEPLTVEVEVEEGWKADTTKELLPVLMLMKERGRISQDLLKANFGGSAKASNILSILETRGFIGKPEGTNKWHINWDKVEEYLAADA